MPVYQLHTTYCTEFPEELEEGMIYISNKFKTAVHSCCCGCKARIVTPFKQGHWRLSMAPEGVTLHPSIGNMKLPCRSHYWIRRGQVSFV